MAANLFVLHTDTLLPIVMVTVSTAALCFSLFSGYGHSCTSLQVQFCDSSALILKALDLPLPFTVDNPPQPPGKDLALFWGTGHHDAK